MTEREIWERGVALLREEYEALSPMLKRLIQIYASQIKACKGILHMTAEAAGAGVCAAIVAASAATAGRTT